MVQSLSQAVGAPQECDPATVGASVARLMHSPSGVVFVSGGGFIAGEVVQTIINPEPVGFEHGWFASDASGIRLLAAFEKWCADMGCKKIRMSSAAGAGVAGKILNKRGYRAVEMAWIK